jgi:hypothetical protein
MTLLRWTVALLIYWVGVFAAAFLLLWMGGL